MTKSWQEQYEVLGRRMTPVIFAVLGVGMVFVELSSLVHPAGRTEWLVACGSTLAGLLLVLCSIGMWARKKYGWYAGLFAFPIAAAVWLPTAFSNYSLDDKPRIILEIWVTVLLICQAGFWPVMWKRYKKWFASEEKSRETLK